MFGVVARISLYRIRQRHKQQLERHYLHINYRIPMRRIRRRMARAVCRIYPQTRLLQTPPTNGKTTPSMLAEGHSVRFQYLHYRRRFIHHSMIPSNTNSSIHSVHMHHHHYRPNSIGCIYKNRRPSNITQIYQVTSRPRKTARMLLVRRQLRVVLSRRLRPNIYSFRLIRRRRFANTR